MTISSAQLDYLLSGIDGRHPQQTVAKAAAANVRADLSSSEALIAHLKLAIEKLRRELYGTRSERKARLLDQMELQLEELEASATEDKLAAEPAAARTQAIKPFQRKRPSCKPFPRPLIEIELGDGKRVSVDENVDAEALGRVLDVLSRR